mmetsp:Transcript_28637/g.75845  ORF Transcript_28637/g.75845 Transcript_28637/m.75845 type:complete len:172 (+) Transcript_28637:96-611(+)
MSIPVISRSSPAAAAGGDKVEGEKWDVKDWSLAGGVGATVCVVTGALSLGTLALVGVGAGVGYSAGQWIVDKMADRDEKEAGKRGELPGQDPLASLHPQALASLEHWRCYLGSRGAGCHLTPQGVGAIFAEFEQREAGHARNVRAVGTPAVMQAIQDQSGITVVAGGASEV